MANNTTQLALLSTAIMVGLKLEGTLTWSWWVVTLPVWGGLALAFISFAILIGVWWLFND